ncbi:hypothetical protein, partial [Pantoea agglomerans]|uniref:hypothetical protein n=1 Tax=Enterobacter agglomerans TaxID=549 RepID=UPI001A90972D
MSLSVVCNARQNRAFQVSQSLQPQRFTHQQVKIHENGRFFCFCASGWILTNQPVHLPGIFCFVLAERVGFIAVN